MYHKEPSPLLCDDVEGQKRGVEGSRWKGYCTLVIDSLCHTAETNTTLHVILQFLKKKIILTSHFSLLLRSLNYSHVYPLWDTPDEKGMTFFFQTPECCTVVYMYWKRKKKIKGISSLEKHGLTHISREDFPIACLLVEKHEAASYWSFILSSALGTWPPGGVPSGGPLVGELSKKKEKEVLREDSRSARCFPPSSLVTGFFVQPLNSCAAWKLKRGSERVKS